MNKRFATSLLGLCVLFSLVGCTLPSRISSDQAAPTASWNGRMSVRVEATPVQGPQAFSSTFELQGGPTQGQLHFYTPLGSTAAAIVWSPQQAQMQAGNNILYFDSITELIARVLGTPVPVAALFAWLAGEHLSLDGWQVDQSQFDHGKITARRVNPSPSAEIRVVLEP